MSAAPAVATVLAVTRKPVEFFHDVYNELDDGFLESVWRQIDGFNSMDANR
jgi:hypothetical protein